MPDPRETDGELSIRRISGPVREVAASLTFFDHVVAVTENPVVTMIQHGVYARPSFLGSALALERGRIALRIAPDVIDGVVSVDDPARPDDAPTLHFLDEDGRTAHRSHLMQAGSRMLIEGLGRVDDSGIPGYEAAMLLEGGIPDLEVEPDTTDLLGRVDAAIVTGLPGAWSEPGARSVSPAVLPALLSHLCAVELPVGIAAFGRGSAQITSGVVHMTDWSSGRLGVTTSEALLDLDPSVVRDVVRVRAHGPHGATSSVEVYDANGVCVLVLTQFGVVGEHVHAAWEQLAASLPLR